MTGPRSGRVGGGFTLVELLVAIGSLVFVAVGIAGVFASIGDTVARGRSVSALSAYAAVLERQLREDFASMSREGFLVIRHELADEGNPVPLFAGQPIGAFRERRIDEILFFTDRPSRSAREPLAPGFVPEGSAARVYIGHGQRRRVDVDPSSFYRRPDVGDENLTGDLLGDPAAGNPNRFARSWTLLRHETALVQPGGALADRPPLSGALLAASDDNRLQIALQPAAESVFRSVNRLDFSGCGTFFPSVSTIRETSASGAGTATSFDSPLFASGLVDVATTSLDEIRAQVSASPALTIVPGPPTEYAYLTPAELTDCGDYTGVPAVVGPVGVQQAWMLDALPAPSHDVFVTLGGSGPFAPGVEPGYATSTRAPDERARVRYEPAAPDLHTAFGQPSAVERAIRLADQQMLASSTLVPSCSEFIVEFSFGKTDEDGRLIWHGAEREIDVDRDGAFDPAIDERVLPYPQYYKDVRGTPADRAGSHFVPYRLRTPPTDSSAPGVGDNPREMTAEVPVGDPIAPGLAGDYADVGDRFASFPVLPEVVHGVEDARGDTLVSYFGYTLPFFDPDDPDNDGDGGDAAASDVMPWPWPELVRVTITLVDPADESIERTFQYVFPTPAEPVQ